MQNSVFCLDFITSSSVRACLNLKAKLLFLPSSCIFQEKWGLWWPNFTPAQTVTSLVLNKGFNLCNFTGVRDKEVTHIKANMLWQKNWQPDVNHSPFGLAQQQEIKKKPHTWQHLLHLDMQQKHSDKAKSEVFFPNHCSDNFIMTQILCSLTVICAHSPGFFYSV